MDERMLNTGPTPVGTRLEGLPAAGNTERKFSILQAIIGRFSRSAILTTHSQQAPRNRGRRRGGRTGQAQGRDGHVACPRPLRINIHVRTSLFPVFFGAGEGFLFSSPMHWMPFCPVSDFASKPCISLFCSYVLALSVRPKFLSPRPYTFPMWLRLLWNHIALPFLPHIFPQQITRETNRVYAALFFFSFSFVLFCREFPYHNRLFLDTPYS